MSKARRLVEQDPGWRRFVDWDAEVVKCTLCKHYHLQGYKVCDVYPKGIPGAIFFGGGCNRYEEREE